MNEREIFSKTLLLTDRAERAAYLDEACGADAALRQRMEQLLALHENGHALFDRRPAELLEALADASPATDAGAAPTAEAGAKQLAAFLAPATRPDALGRLGHYEVLHVLGQGGFGIVVRALDETLHRIVAIKVLAPHLALTSPPRKRFLREARAAAQVRHEHVVQIYAVEEQPVPYLVMEFIEGQTLQQRLEATGPLEAAEVVRLGQQIALGLAAAHDKTLIHRDVKPTNIILEAGPVLRVKLTDFGLARTSDDASMTQSGVLAGTPLFMAPEQAQGAPLDYRMDLFSLGSVLYTMTTGRPPFRARGTFAVLKRVVEDTPRPIREIMADVPDGLCAVIARLLEKSPADRFASARETAEALSRCLTDPVPAPTVAPRRRRIRLAYAAAALVLMAGAMWLAVQAARPARQDERSPDAANAAQPDERPSPGQVAPPPPTPLTVTSILDDGSEGTLRWAVAQANNRPGPDAIVFDPVVFGKPRTITLAKGLLTFTDEALTSLTGPAAGLTLSGDNKSQVFVIGAADRPASAFLSGLTIAQGYASQEFPLGGGVLSKTNATLTMIGCTLVDNAAPEDGGGGLYNYNGTVALTNCTFTRNKGKEGGGLKNFGGHATATLTNCTFVGNSSDLGGGILSHGGGRTYVFNCLFANNPGGDLVSVIDGVTTGDYNLTGDGSAPGSHSKTNTDPQLGALGHHGGPTQTIPLLPGSPAIDAGSNAPLLHGIRTDQRGLPRIVKGTVDLGAYEVQ